MRKESSDDIKSKDFYLQKDLPSINNAIQQITSALTN